MLSLQRNEPACTKTYSSQIWTCLPAPESDFQHSRPVLTELLSEAIESSGQKMLGPFAEVIVLTTLCWRSLALKRSALMENVYGSEAYTDSWTRHTRLYHLLQKRLALLSVPASSAELLDPMRLFTNLLANAAVIWHYKVTETVSENMNEQLSLVPLYSASEIVGLTKPLTRYSFFKVRLLPILIDDLSRFLMRQYRHIHSPRCCFFFRQSFSRPIRMNGSPLSRLWRAGKRSFRK